MGGTTCDVCRITAGDTPLAAVLWHDGRAGGYRGLLQVYYSDPEDEDHNDVTHGCLIDWFPGKDLTVRRMLLVARRPPLEQQQRQSARV